MYTWVCLFCAIHFLYESLEPVSFCNALHVHIIWLYGLMCVHSDKAQNKWEQGANFHLIVGEMLSVFLQNYAHKQRPGVILLINYSKILLVVLKSLFQGFHSDCMGLELSTCKVASD